VVPADLARFTTMDPINQAATMPERLMGNLTHSGADPELRRETNREPRGQARAVMSIPRLPAVKRLFALAIAGACLVSGSALQAQVVLSPPTPQAGSSNTVSADPTVPRPHTRSCTVQLFQDMAFADYTPKTFSYAPPEGCLGPWAKVVFVADFTVTAGLQYDRTAKLFLGGANLFFGTTPEPRTALSPSWHVENDVTDLTALLKTGQSGVANIGNFVGVYGGSNYNGIIYANARLEFYPAPWRDHDHEVRDRGHDHGTRAPDVVIGLQGDSDATTLSTTTSQLSKTLTLPTNIEAAYLDVIVQGQSSDEFWYRCVPDDVKKALGRCGGTGFRETEISIDGVPAGVAPVYPWIFTGGISPYLWEPIPGVQTLNLKPYRVDLTPFAGLLSDGRPHIVAVSVFNASSYFAATATLLLYTDLWTDRVTGAVLSNDLAPQPAPTLSEDVMADGNGSVTVASERQFAITGYVNTSHGRVETTVRQTLSFNSTQNFVKNLTAFHVSGDLTQSTIVNASTITREGRSVTEDDRTFSYPLSLHNALVKNADATLTVMYSSNQGYMTTDTRRSKGDAVTTEETSNQVASQFSSNLGSTLASSLHPTNSSSSSQQYLARNSRGYCYSRTLTSADNVLTGYQDGEGCPTETRGDAPDE
jgi:Peptide N-acetyl-beta-D-glucosaminyl asparaginase amidase A